MSETAPNSSPEQHSPDTHTQPVVPEQTAAAETPTHEPSQAATSGLLKVLGTRRLERVTADLEAAESGKLSREQVARRDARLARVSRLASANRDIAYRGNAESDENGKIDPSTIQNPRLRAAYERNAARLTRAAKKAPGTPEYIAELRREKEQLEQQHPEHRQQEIQKTTAQISAADHESERLYQQRKAAAKAIANSTDASTRQQATREARELDRRAKEVEDRATALRDKLVRQRSDAARAGDTSPSLRPVGIEERRQLDERADSRHSSTLESYRALLQHAAQTNTLDESIWDSVFPDTGSDTKRRFVRSRLIRDGVIDTEGHVLLGQDDIDERLRFDSAPADLVRHQQREAYFASQREGAAAQKATQQKNLAEVARPLFDRIEKYIHETAGSDDDESSLLDARLRGSLGDGFGAWDEVLYELPEDDRPAAKKLFMKWLRESLEGDGTAQAKLASMEREGSKSKTEISTLGHEKEAYILESYGFNKDDIDDLSKEIGEAIRNEVNARNNGERGKKLPDAEFHEIVTETRRNVILSKLVENPDEEIVSALEKALGERYGRRTKPHTKRQRR